MAITTTTTTTPTVASPVKNEPAPSPASSPSPTDNAADAESKSPLPTNDTAKAQEPKRRNRRANTAEGRATHNAVERMRRETLNGRFVTLASMLPPLAAIRRPSKAAIVNSSLATVHAARRHRVQAAQTLRALTREAEVLRREVNEWRARARIPQLEVPVRSDAHTAVLRAEVEDFDLELEEGIELEEDGEEAENNNENEGGESPEPASPQSKQRARSASTSSAPGSAYAPSSAFFAPAPQSTATYANRARSASINSTPGSAHGSSAAFYDSPLPPTPIESLGRFAFELPPSPSSSGGWDGPVTPPGSAGAVGMGMVPQMHMYDVHSKGAAGYFAPVLPAGAGAAYDLGLGFDGEQSLFGVSTGLGMSAMAMGGVPGMLMGGGWASANPAHPAFHHQEQAAAQAFGVQEVYKQQQAMTMGAGVVPIGMQMQMGISAGGLPFGVAPGQYLHQPAGF